MDEHKKDSSSAEKTEGKSEKHDFKPVEHKEFHSDHDSEHSHKKETTLTDKFRENPWMVSTIVLGIVAVILLLSSFSGGFTGAAVGVANQDDVTQRVINFLNTQVPEGVQHISTELEGGLYKITVDYQGTQVPVYVTADGESLVQGVTPFDIVEQAQNASQNQEPIEVSVDDDPVKGNPSAQITIVEFSDFECPFCGKFYAETYDQIITAYVNTGKANLVFRDFPLSSIHPNAQKASEAAQCAFEQGKFWEMHDKLFENQQALEIEDLKQYAKDLKLNTVKFNDCLDSGKYEEEVANDVSEGASYGVTGTPAFFINGKLIAGAYPLEEFQKIIDEELAKASA